MRGALRRIGREEEEEESSFVSMTDMTVSFLFIVMILLAFFASQFHDADRVPKRQFDEVVADRDDARRQVATLQDRVDQQDATIRGQSARIAELEKRDAELLGQNAELEKRNAELQAQVKRLKPNSALEDYLAEVAEQRRRILESLRNRLQVDYPDLQVVISPELDALRFKGDGLFERNSSALKSDKRSRVEKIAEHLDELLPCYTLGPRSAWKADCNPGGVLLEAVQIEGHTDSAGSDTVNVPLSTDRAVATFFAMTKHQTSLIQHLNERKQPVISVSGYGAMRPVADNSSPEGQATNRRIDLRLIMYTPTSLDDIARVQADLRKGLAEGPGR
jgi:flagellar motor protein MotB